MENYRLTQTGEEVQGILNGAAMQTDLTAENERAEGAEQTLQGNIDEEERRAKAAEQTLQGNIDEEERRAKAAEETLGGAIDGINAKIPAAASSENKLADQDFVNSSIETATATFRGTYNLVSDLHLAVDATHEQIATLLGTVIAEADNNDYAYVLVPTSAQTPTEIASIEKYTFGANGWAFAYALNNSGFTSAQWAAINSGITSGLVGKLNALPTNTDLLALLAGKQDVLTFDDVPVEGSNNPVKSGGVHSAIDDEKTARVNAMNQLSGRVDTIEGEIPAQASSENQLADKAYVNSSISTNTATYRGSFNLVADLGLSVSATHEQIGTALAGEISTADNNDYAYVQVPTSDETPTQILKVERYKFNGTAWAFEYELNSSGFTSAQWAAINSGITSGLVGKLNALPTNDELTLALAGKQDVLTFDNTPTENSNNPVKSSGVYAADKALSDAIEAILLLIPSAATSLNKLVDTDLMNSSISTATATFRGTFNLVSDLSLDLTATHAQIATALAGAIATADNNDYAFVQVPTSASTPTEIASTDRYKFNGTAWAFEYTLNNSGFTSAQWAAINSAITTELVAKLTALPTNAELLESLGLLSSGISGINAKIPSAASSENKLVDGTAMETYVAQIVNAIDATFNVTSTDGHVTLAITQVNGAITSVQLTTSDIASAAALTLLAGRVTSAEGNITSLTGRMTTAEGDIDQLLALYNALQQSAPQVIQPTDTWPVANPSTTVIYRVIDRVNTPPQYYSDYMWNGTAFVLMATYNNAIDDAPTAGSNNLVKSGGVSEESQINFGKFVFTDSSNIPYYSSNGTPQYNGNREKTILIPVSEGDRFIVSLSNYWNAYCVAAFDSSKNFLSDKSIAQDVNWTNHEFTVPSGVSYISFCANPGYGSAYKKTSIYEAALKVNSTSKDKTPQKNSTGVVESNGIYDAIGGVNLQILGYDAKLSDLTTGVYWKADGTSTTGTRKISGLLSVKKGMMFFYNLNIYNTELLIAAFDNDYNIVLESSIAGTNNYKNGSYVVPEGISFVQFQTDANASDSFVKYNSPIYNYTQPNGVNLHYDDLIVGGVVYLMDGTSSVSSGRRVSGIIKVNSGSRFYYSGYQYSNGPIIAAFDADMNFLPQSSVAGNDTRYQADVYTVPSGVEYIQYQTMNGDTQNPLYGIKEISSMDIQIAELQGNVIPSNGTKLNGFADFMLTDNWTISDNGRKASTIQTGYKKGLFHRATCTNESLNRWYATQINEDRWNISAILKPVGSIFEVVLGKWYPMSNILVSLKYDGTNSKVCIYVCDSNWTPVLTKEFSLTNISLISGKKYGLRVEKMMDVTCIFNIYVTDEKGNIDSFENIKNADGSALSWGWGTPCAYLSEGTSVEITDFSYGQPIEGQLRVIGLGHSWMEASTMTPSGSSASVDYDIENGYMYRVINAVGKEHGLNLARGGEWSKNLVEKMDDVIKWFSNTRYCIINIGGNDYSGGVTPEATATLIANCEYVKKMLNDFGIIPIWIVDDGWYSNTAAEYADYNAWLLSQPYHVDVRGCFYENGVKQQNAYLGDGKHPTPETHEKIFNCIKAQAGYLFNI